MKKSPRANLLLRQARLARNWSQSRLAEEVGVQTQTVKSWERGTRFPVPDSREHLCRIFAMSPEQLGLQLPDPVEQDGKELMPSVIALTDSVTPDAPGAEAGERDGQPVSFQQGPRQDANRRRMLRRVRSIWIEGVLEHSLYQATLIILGLQEQPDAVANPWRLEVQESDLPPRPLPAGTRITSVYAAAEGELLILGDPGAGKTTLLLELARDLLDRADRDPTHPLPVVLNLSSWAQRRHLLADWIVEELSGKYQVGRQLAREWVETDHILPLLDGLDEVAEAHRTTCVEAVNSYRQKHGLTPMVICSRRPDYFAQAARLRLSTAVVVQPLTEQQIDEYLSVAGTSLGAMRMALQHDPLLREMASTPLMLNILAITYQGISIEDMLAVNSSDERRRIVFEHYIERVLRRRGSGHYPHQQTKRWLTWLAKQMQEHSQTEFYLEHLQPTWLEDKPQKRYQNTSIRLILGGKVFIDAGVLALFRGDSVPTQPGLFSWLGSKKLGNSLLGWMSPGLGGTIQGATSLGICIGLITVIVGFLVRKRELPTLSMKVIQRGLLLGLRDGLIYGVSTGAFATLVYHLGGWAQATERGLGIGLFIGALTGLLGALLAILGPERKPGPALQQSPDQTHQRRQIMIRLLNTLIFSICAACGFGWIFAALSGGITRLVIEDAVVVGFFYGIGFGLGRGSDIVPDLKGEITPAEVVTWSGIRRNLADLLRRGGLVSLFITGCAIATTASISSAFYGVRYGVKYGLVFGLIVGCIGGLAAIFTGMLTRGWSSQVAPEHQRVRPNEGIRRSLRNAALTACCFGLIGGLASGLFCGLTFGLLGGLAGWPTLGIGFALVSGIVFAFQFFLLHGGVASLEHVVLRWSLWKAGHVPWNYVRFLDYAAERILLRKVGGGYIFVHRLLQEYFSSLPET